MRACVSVRASACGQARQRVRSRRPCRSTTMVEPARVVQPVDVLRGRRRRRVRPLRDAQSRGAPRSAVLPRRASSRAPRAPSSAAALRPSVRNRRTGRDSAPRGASSGRGSPGCRSPSRGPRPRGRRCGGRAAGPRARRARCRGMSWRTNARRCAPRSSHPSPEIRPPSIISRAFWSAASERSPPARSSATASARSSSSRRRIRVFVRPSSTTFSTE